MQKKLSQWLKADEAYTLEKNLQKLKPGQSVQLMLSDLGPKHYQPLTLDIEADDLENTLHFTGTLHLASLEASDQSASQLNLERLETLIRSLNAGILLENENREIVFVNQKFCNFFQIPAAPIDLIGADSKSPEQSKHSFKSPDAFVGRIDQILAEKELVLDEQVEFKDGKVLERDYIPFLIHY